MQLEKSRQRRNIGRNEGIQFIGNAVGMQQQYQISLDDLLNHEIMVGINAKISRDRQPFPYHFLR